MGEARKPFYKLVLERELATRLARNPQYSLRAFARTLAVDAGALSRLLTGKRTLSLRTAGRVAAQLPLSGDERRLFLVSVAEDQKIRALSKAEPDAPQPDPEPRSQELEHELFRVIAELHHYAIMELTRVEGFRADPRWIARRLGIAPHAARQATLRLLKLGLLERDDGEQRGLRKTARKVTTKDKAASTPALRRHQRQIVERALETLESVPIERRCHAGMTMAIDPELVPIARQAIQDFMEELCRALGSGVRKEVYQLGVQLFPLERGDRP